MREKEVLGGYFIRDDGTFRTKTGKITIGCLTKPGYRQTTMYHEKRMISKFIHILVAKAFVENPRPDIFNKVDHIDHNRENNHWTNLRWVDAELNKTHQVGACVVYTGDRFRPWCSRPYRMKRMSFATEAEALECSRRRKEERFEKLYKEKLESEPRFKSVGVQTCPFVRGVHRVQVGSGGLAAWPAARLGT